MKNIYALITGVLLWCNCCTAQLTRTQIINNALPYTTFTWTAYADNVLSGGHSCNITGETVYAPTCWVAVGTNTSMPYCWGGFTTMAQHIAQMTANSNTQAGDVCSSTGSSCANGGGCSALQSAPLSCASGNDCSGFISVVWGMTSKYSTRTLPNISTQITLSQTQPGDIVDIPGDHTRLIETNYGNGNYQVIESSANGWNCAVHTYTASNLASYTPYCWNNVVGGCSPTTGCSPATTNDYCYGPPVPAVLTPGATISYISGTTCGATQSMAPASCSGTTAATALDVWYSFTADNPTATVYVQSGNTFDAVLQVLSAACGTSMQCVNSTGQGGLETVNLTGLSVGTVYYIRLYDYNGNANGTDFQISVVSTGATCSGWSVSPTSGNPASTGGSGSFNVNVSGGTCPYTTQSSVNWINNISVSGNTVSYTVNANTTCATQTGYIYVYDASNALQATYTVHEAGLTVPATPGSISGATNPCSGGQLTYSVSSVSGSTSYTWTLPNGWSGSSTADFINATAGNSSGNISVTANNGCGSSAASTMGVTANTVPVQSGSINGSSAVCAGSSNTYSVASVNGATSYTWTLPNGWTGSSTSNSISTTAGNSGNIIVTANNTCGTSNAFSYGVTVNQVPAQPGSLTGNTTVCANSSNTYTAAAVNGATSYTWTLPNGWTGSSTGNSITTTAGGNGNISVTANNACGASTPISTAVTVNPVPVQPGGINGNTTVCENSSNTYSVPAVNGASSYTWTLPNGWSGSSTSNSITTSAGSSGNISVTANNACGASAAISNAITVNTVPAQPGTISGNATVCTNSANTYSVATVNGATSYTWTLPNGWSGTSATNSIAATTGSSGNVTVVANNSCGSSAQQTMNVIVSNTPTVNISPAGPVICPGNSVVLTASVSGTAYAWSGPNNFNGNTISVSATTGGNYSVTVTGAGGCTGTFSANVNVIQASAPTADAGNPQTVSAGTPVTLGGSPTASGGTGSYTYAWSSYPPGGLTSSAANPQVAPNATTTYFVTATDANGCSGSASVSISIHTTVCDSSIHPTLTANLCDLAAVYYSSATYQWMLNGNPISTATSRFYVVDSAGYYTCAVTMNNCSYFTNDTFIRFNQGDCSAPTTIEETDAIKNLAIVPNPSSGSFMVSFEVKSAEEIEIGAYDLLGQLVQSEVPVKGNGVYRRQISLGNVAKGVYILQIRTGGVVVNRRVEVE